MKNTDKPQTMDPVQKPDWVDIPGFEGIYATNKLGQVLSRARIALTKTNTRPMPIRIKERILKPTFRKPAGLTAYYSLHKNGKRIQFHTIMYNRPDWTPPKTRKT